MTARAIVYPASFGDSSLPRIELGYSPPTPGALYSWTADGLPLGDLNDWASSATPMSLGALAGASQVVESGGRRAVRLNGVNNGNRLQAAFALAGAHSVLAVCRFTRPPVAGDAIFYDLAGAGAGSVSVAADGSNNIAAYGGAWITPAPPIVPDSAWRVVLLTVNGASSALRVDSREQVGTFSGPARQGLTLGFSNASGNNRAAIEYRRLEVFTGATNSQWRATLVAQMRARYGIA